MGCWILELLFIVWSGVLLAIYVMITLSGGGFLDD